MQIRQFTRALDYLAFYRVQAAQILFPGDLPHQVAYRKEWHDRDLHAFWTHLDEDNRVKVLALAAAHYLKAGEDLRKSLADLNETGRCELPPID